MSHVPLISCSSISVVLIEKRVLRRIFGPKRVKVTGGWRKLHNEELHNLCSSPNVIRIIKLRRMRWAGHLARMGWNMNACRTFVEKPEGKRTVGRPRISWEDYMTMNLREVGWGGMDRIVLAEDRDRWRAVMNTVMNIRVP
jgi:hypothetical protein